MGSKLEEGLRAFCCQYGWSYGVYWRLHGGDSGLLTAGRAYYEDHLGNLMSDVLHRVHRVGDSMVGMAALNGRHNWIFSDEYSSNIFQQDHGGWNLQFISGIKTIAILPLQPLGVLQFGSYQKILENLEFIGRVKDMIQNTDFLSELLTCGDFFSDGSNLMKHPQKYSTTWMVSSNSTVDFQSSILHQDEALALMEQQLLQAIEPPTENSSLVSSDHDLFGGMDLDITTTNCSNLTSTSLLDCIPELDVGFLEKDFFSDCLNLQQLVSSSTVGDTTSSANTVNSSTIGSYNSGNQYSCSSTTHVGNGSSGATNKTAVATTSRSKKPVEERRNLARKKAKPEESTRPRPKDRQLIQDRVKELREIVPNGSKCSIDALLNRTINHMIYLQNLTSYADKIKQLDGTKMIGEECGVVLRDSANAGNPGATWAFEVAGQTMVCPILVEDLSPPGQMLVEMLCEEHGFFLEIAEVIRGFGLTILKGVMEAPAGSCKIWARFLVEANRQVTRMEIFMSLVQLLQQTCGGGEQPSKVEPGLIHHGNYGQSKLPVFIRLPERLL